MRSLGDAQAALLELEGRVAAEAGERDRLVDRRFGLLSDVLGTINAELSQARTGGGREAGHECREFHVGFSWVVPDAWVTHGCCA